MKIKILKKYYVLCRSQPVGIMNRNINNWLDYNSTKVLIRHACPVDRYSLTPNATNSRLLIIFINLFISYLLLTRLHSNISQNLSGRRWQWFPHFGVSFHERGKKKSCPTVQYLRRIGGAYPCFCLEDESGIGNNII